MASSKQEKTPRPVGISKAASGIKGLDEITGGGLPEGRPTLICGSAGSGKTMLALEFLVRGATEYAEPGVFMAFEETQEDLAKNVASLGFDLNDLIARKKLVVDYVHIEPSEIQETGDYDLEGLFVRLQYAIDAVGAKRVVLDTLEALFSGLSNQAILRAEIRRLFRWLKDRKLTAVITGEKGDGVLTRYGLEEYVSDCVILLDNRVQDQIASRRLRIVKYRGSSHGPNEYPFLIDNEGFSVLPLSSLRLQHPAPTQRISSGIPDLDKMFGGKGYYRGSTILISGTAGSGKTSLAAHFAGATCARGEKCVYFSFEESFNQLARNMRSIGLDLKRQQAAGRLHFQAWRPTMYGLEMHLLQMHKVVEQFKPSVVIVDPITALLTGSAQADVQSVMMRFIDFMKGKQITGLLTSLTGAGSATEQTEVGISSLIDTWLLVRDLEINGERNRAIYVIKSRGMAHSNQVREFVISSSGLRLIPAYTGGGRVLTGTSRVVQEAEEAAERLNREREIERKRMSLEVKRKSMEAQIAALREQFEAEQRDIASSVTDLESAEQQSLADRDAFARSRKANGSARENDESSEKPS